MESVARGAKERNKVEEAEAKRRERERLDEKKRRKRQGRKEMWTTPGQRPLAEPPILDWDNFFRCHIPSDMRYKALFPNDPVKRAAIKDLQGESQVLSQYVTFAYTMIDEPAVDEAKEEFYKNLGADLYADWEEVDKEYVAIFNMATELCRFEYSQLDNDGKTTQLENWVKRGANMFYEAGEEVKRKYQYLVPPDFVEDPLVTFEFVWLENDGRNGHIEYQMECGNDVLIGWPQEVQDKYGHLRSSLPAVTESEDEPQNSSRGSSSQVGSDQPEYSGKDEDEMEEEEESDADGSEDADDDELSGSEPDNYRTTVESEA